MKKFLILFLMFAVVVTSYSQAQEVPADADSLAAVIGTVKSVAIEGDTTIVTNTDDHQYILIGENVGTLIATLLTGIAQVKENVGGTEGRAIDWIMEIVKWLLGGSLTSLIAYGSRSIAGVKDLFAKIAKNRRLVVGIAGALAFGWLMIQGGNLKESIFWLEWGATWFAFSMFAMGLYDTVFSRFIKTEKTPAEQDKKLDEATAMVESSGGKVSFK